MAVPGLEFQIFSPRSWRAYKYQVKEFGILLEGNRDLLTVTNSLIYERRHFPLEYTQINCTSIKEVSKPFLFLWALVKPLGLVPLYAVKTVYAIWLQFWGFFLQGLRPWATSVALSEIYLTIFLRLHILYATPALRGDGFVHWSNPQ